LRHQPEQIPKEAATDLRRLGKPVKQVEGGIGNSVGDRFTSGLFAHAVRDL
jgi:hypothetical protein